MKVNREYANSVLRKEGRTYYLRLRVGMSRLCVWRARGMPVCHFVPYNAEFAPEDKGG
jgi:hypothetical protein